MGIIYKTFDVDDGTIYGANPEVRLIEVLGLDLVNVVFSNDVLKNDAYYDVSNYTIRVVSPIDAAPVSVREVIVPNGTSSIADSALLRVSTMQVGATYELELSDQLKGRDGAASAVSIRTFTPRRTKIESILRSLPNHFDKSYTSVIRNLLTALAAVDEQIGGEYSKILVPATNTTNVTLQQLFPAGIPSEEAVGTPSAAALQQIITNAGDIGSEEAFGSHILKMFIQAAGGIASAEAFGSPSTAHAGQSSLWDFTTGTFVRNSEASYYDGSPHKIAWAGIDELRFENRGDGNGGAWLFEGGRTNLAADPENLSVWNFSNSSLGSSNLIAPDGDADAYSVQYNAIGNARAETGVTSDPADNELHAVSYWTFLETGTSVKEEVRFLSEGGSLSNGASDIKGSQWTRLSQVYDMESGATAPLMGAEANDSLGSRFGVWGAQIEEGLFPTSYIRGGTREADFLSFDASQVPEELLSGRWEFDFYPDFSSDPAEMGSSVFHIFSFPGTNSNDGIYLYQATGARVRFSKGGALPVNAICTWSRGQKLTIGLNLVDGVAYLSGFTTGNGVYTFTPFRWTPRATYNCVGTRSFSVGTPSPSQSFFGRISEPRKLRDDLLWFDIGTFTRNGEASYLVVEDEVPNPRESVDAVANWSVENLNATGLNGNLLYDPESRIRSLVVEPSTIAPTVVYDEKLGRDVVAFTSGRYARNGNTGVQFDTSEFAFFGLVRVVDLSPANGSLIFQATSNSALRNFNIQYDSVSGQFEGSFWNDSSNTIPMPFTLGEWVSLGIWYDGTAWHASVNGVDQGSVVTSNSFDVSTMTIAVDEDAVSGLLDMHFAEALVFSTQNGSSLMPVVHQYFVDKWLHPRPLAPSTPPIKWASAHEPRFEDRGDGDGPQLLLEGPATNLILTSRTNLWSPNWIGSSGQTLVSQQTEVAPDNALAANRFGDNGAFNFPTIFGVRNTGVVTQWNANVILTCSGFIKRFGDARDMRVTIVDNTGTQSGGTNVSVAQDWTRLDYTIYDTGSGTFNNGMALGAAPGTDKNDVSYWGAQAEYNPYPTSFIRNGTARVADVLSFDSDQQPPELYSGRFQFDVWPYYGNVGPNDNLNGATYYLFNLPGGGVSDGLYFFENVSRMRLIMGGSSVLTITGMAAPRHQKATVIVDLLDSKIITSGFTTGDGTYPFSGNFASGSTAYVGCRQGALGFFNGRLTMPKRVGENLFDFRQGSFARTSTATYLTSATTMDTAGANELRYEDRGDGYGPQALFEGSSENLIPYSEDFTARSPGWAYESGASKGATIPSPDGTPADVIDLAASATSGVYESSINPLSNISYFSFWAKQVSTTSDIRIRFDDSFAGVQYSGNLPVTPDWARYGFNAFTGSSDYGVANSAAVAGSIGLWGMQYEEDGRNFPTSYIPTNGSTVTRSSDNLEMLDPVVSRVAADLEGAWEFDFWPIYASSEFFTGDAFLFNFPDIAASAGILLGSGTLLTFRTTGIVGAQSVTFSRHQKITVAVDWVAGTYRISGATAGNGSYNFSAGSTPWLSIPPGATMWVGSRSGAAHSFARISPPRKIIEPIVV